MISTDIVNRGYGDYFFDFLTTKGKNKKWDILTNPPFKYAEQFIRTRLATKPVSKSHLYRQLAEHHVPSEIITEFLAKIPEENELQNAVEIAAKFYRQFQSLEPETRRMRVLSRLEARGFRFDVSQRAYEKAQANTEEE